MTENCLPLSDLHLLREDVNPQSPAAALPSHLPDYWLELIARDLEETVGEGDHVGAESAVYSAAPLALIIQILSGKRGSPRLECSLDEMFEYFCDYRIEINLEIVNRRTRIKAESATLETIFTNPRGTAPGPRNSVVGNESIVPSTILEPRICEFSRQMNGQVTIGMDHFKMQTLVRIDQRAGSRWPAVLARADRHLLN